MEDKPQNEQKQLTERERLDTEIAAINLLQQIGVSFNVPLLQGEIAALTAHKSPIYKLLHPSRKNAIPAEIKVNSRKIPNPINPEEEIDYYEGEISIRPLYLDTICTIRAKRLELELKDSEFKERLESTDINDTYLLRYVDEICEVLAVATLNIGDVRKHRKEVNQWAAFYRKHLTNQRYMKLVQVVMIMMDAQSFRASTRLILGLGTTAPREASRVANQSKD